MAEAAPSRSWHQRVRDAVTDRRVLAYVLMPLLLACAFALLIALNVLLRDLWGELVYAILVTGVALWALSQTTLVNRLFLRLGVRPFTIRRAILWATFALVALPVAGDRGWRGVLVLLAPLVGLVIFRGIQALGTAPERRVQAASMAGGGRRDGRAPAARPGGAVTGGERRGARSPAGRRRGERRARGAGRARAPVPPVRPEGGAIPARHRGCGAGRPHQRLQRRRVQRGCGGPPPSTARRTSSRSPTSRASEAGGRAAPTTTTWSTRIGRTESTSTTGGTSHGTRRRSALPSAVDRGRAGWA